MINIWRINLSNIIKGCYSAWEIADYKIVETDELAILQRKRLEICNGCKLHQNGVCFRDTKNIFQEDKDFTMDEMMKKQSIVNIKTRKLVLGCGCNTKCKTAVPDEECPASKW